MVIGWGKSRGFQRDWQRSVAWLVVATRGSPYNNSLSSQLLCMVFCILYFILQQKNRDRWEGKKPVFIPVP